jgi:hypothetical protein
VEDVRAMGMNDHSMLIEAVVGVPADLPAAVDQEHARPKLGCGSLSDDQAGEAGADNEQSVNGLYRSAMLDRTSVKSQALGVRLYARVQIANKSATLARWAMIGLTHAPPTGWETPRNSHSCMTRCDRNMTGVKDSTRKPFLVRLSINSPRSKGISLGETP